MRRINKKEKTDDRSPVKPDIDSIEDDDLKPLAQIKSDSGSNRMVRGSCAPEKNAQF